MIRSVTPYLVVDGAAKATDWYRGVLGAEEVTRMTGGAGRVAHAELRDPFGHIWLLTRSAGPETA